MSRSSSKHEYYDDYDNEETGHDFAISSSSSGPKITLSEIVGERDTQQDAIFAALPSDELACENPAEFFRTAIADISERHQHCKVGTTVCGIIVTPPSEGERFSKITVANLGDSRAVIIAKMKSGDYKSIALTEDHDIANPRIYKHLTTSGAKFIRYQGDVSLRLHGSGLNLGAAIGDHSTTNTQDKNRSPLLTKPDIFQYDLNDFPQDLLPAEEIENIELIVACDGLFDLDDKKDVMKSDFKLIVRRAKNTFVKSSFNSNDPHLSRIKQEFDIRTPNGCFAAALSAVAYEENSVDNISIGTINLVNQGRNMLDHATMLVVCDGHGNGELSIPNDGNIRDDFDGGVVAASVAAELYIGARAKPISGLCNESGQLLPGKYLQSLIDLRYRETMTSSPSKNVASASAAAASSSSQAATSSRSSQ